jgi:hypothetical protein
VQVSGDPQATWRSDLASGLRGVEHVVPIPWHTDRPASRLCPKLCLNYSLLSVLRGTVRAGKLPVCVGLGSLGPNGPSPDALS